MTTMLRAALLLAFCPALASAQLILPTAQARSVSAHAETDGVPPDNQVATAPDFGLFDTNVTANVTGPNGGAMSGAAQTSEILPDSFVVSGNQSASGYSGYANSESRAVLEFDVAVKVAYQVVASYESYDQGFFSYDLMSGPGQWVNGWIGIAEGPQSIEHNGILEPGSYSMQFLVNGGSDYSFATFDAALNLTELSGTYCVAAANSAGAGAALAIGGSTSIASNDFRVDATGVVPGVFGLVFYGPNQLQAPFGDGFRCVGGLTHRVQPPVQADGSGNLSKPISFTTGPASSGNGMITADSTWNFQLWYRDPMGPGGSGFNTSDAAWATFCD